MNQPSILIVEDTKVSANFLADALKMKNYNIAGIVENGEDAINTVKNAPPDLILMDIKIIGAKDGIETAKEINTFADLPIIFITADEDIKYIDRVKEAKPYAYLTKPFKLNDLLYTIETSLYKHQMIARVKESEERLYVIWNNIQTAIMMVEENTNIIQSINPKASEIIGLSSENIIGHTRKEFFINLYGAGMPGGHDSDDAVTREAILLNYNKEEIPIFKTIKKIKIKDKFYFIISFTDNSIQKKNEQEIRNARDEIQALLSSLVTILIGVSIKDEVTHWNKVAERTLGIPASDVLGKKLTQCSINWDWVTIYEGISKSISDDNQVRLTDLHFINSENNDGFLEITVNPVKDKDNAFKGFILTGEDITKKKQMEMQLVQAQKMESIGELSSGIAHEINTPAQYITDNTFFLRDAFSVLLKIIKENSDLIKADAAGGKTDGIIRNIAKIFSENDLEYLMEEIPKAISQSIEGLTRVTKIVQSMKNFAYPDSDKKMELDINKALEDTINISSNKWKYVSDIVRHFDENLPLVSCYPGELNQVFLNIIINSVDAIEEKIGGQPKQKGVIDITTGIEEEYIVITIKDTGAGIPESVINKIFDPFFTTKKVGKGTGQGLTIAYNIIISKHKGSISFESAAGSGTTCVIKIPVGGNG